MRGSRRDWDCAGILPLPCRSEANPNRHLEANQKKTSGKKKIFFSDIAFSIFQTIVIWAPTHVVEYPIRIYDYK